MSIGYHLYCYKFIRSDCVTVMTLRYALESAAVTIFISS